MSQAKSLALLGGPSSGKTTYLGALIDGIESEAISRLAMSRHPTDATSLEELSAPLQDGRYPDRTARGLTSDLNLALETRGEVLPATNLQLNVGDYAGEEVETLFQHRRTGWTKQWQARAQADGLLLFVRPEAWTPLPRLRRPMTEQQRWRALRGETVSLHEPEAPVVASSMPQSPEAVFGPGVIEEVPSTPEAAPDDPVGIPTSMAMIELLQFLRHRRGLAPAERPPRGSFRVAVLVAAWDALDPFWQVKGPRAFLAQNMALLEDYLWSNFYEEDVLRFGLSATGGDLNDSYYQDRYLKDPQGHVVWTDPLGEHLQVKDISMPLCWALFGDRALG